MERKEEFIEILQEAEDNLRNGSMKVVDGQKIISQGSKLLMTFEELEKSRNKWKEKYLNLKSRNSEVKQNL
jgi:hypothetical protein